MSAVLGVDPGGRKWDAVLLVDGEAVSISGHVAAKADLGKESCEMSANWRSHLALLTGVYGPITVFIESPILAGSRNIQTAIRIAETVGVLHSVAQDTYGVSVSEWKKATVGSGNASKMEVAQWVKDTHPQIARLCLRQDHYDAACIALFGEKAVAASGRELESAD